MGYLWCIWFPVCIFYDMHHQNSILKRLQLKNTAKFSMPPPVPYQILWREEYFNFSMAFLIDRLTFGRGAQSSVVGWALLVESLWSAVIIPVPSAGLGVSRAFPYGPRWYNKQAELYSPELYLVLCHGSAACPSATRSPLHIPESPIPLQSNHLLKPEAFSHSNLIGYSTVIV